GGPSLRARTPLVRESGLEFPSLLLPEGDTKMLSKHAINGSALAPSFEAARNRRQRARAAGLHPDYWYAVEYDRAVPRGGAVEVRFWNTSIALYRGDDGQLHAVENRCAHRQLKLTLGNVEGCNLTCAYHGWSYDGQGRVVGVAHDLFG